MRAYMFSGQGAQKPGMGKAFLEKGGAGAGVIERLSKQNDRLIYLLTEADAAELAKTVNTQPAVFAMSAAALAELGGEADGYIGFSLGEYAALYASGALGLEDAFDLVMFRAGQMEKCAESTNGAMVAVLGKDGEELDEIISRAKTGDLLIPVNYNCPGQTVVAGDAESCAKLMELCRAERVRAVKLPVGGAFHSPYMAPAADAIAAHIAGMEIAAPKGELYSNVTGAVYEQATFRETLAAQTKSPVRFRQAIASMVAKGYDDFIEIGVGNTLAGFVKRIDGGVKSRVWNEV